MTSPAATANGGHRLVALFAALFVVLLSLLVCSDAARTYEETEAYFEKSVNFANDKARQLLEEPGWTVYSHQEQHTRTKSFPLFATYKVSWAFESENCVGWRNPTLLITCTGEGKPVLISKGSTDSKTDCASTNSAVVCIIPIEDQTSLSSTMKATDILTFECRGNTETDLLAGIGLRAQELTCMGSNISAKQGLKMDVIWGTNMAYSFQCKTIDSVLTTFDDKGHCMSMIRPEDCQSGDSGSPCMVSLPKRYLTQINDFFEKNPAAVIKSASAAPAAQDAVWNSDSTPSTPTTTQFVSSS